MNADTRFDQKFLRLSRLTMFLLGAAGFGYEVLSPHRTLWVGLLCVGLLTGQAAALISLLSHGIVVRARVEEDEKEALKK